MTPLEHEVAAMRADVSKALESIRGELSEVAAAVRELASAVSESGESVAETVNDLSDVLVSVQGDTAEIANILVTAKALEPRLSWWMRLARRFGRVGQAAEIEPAEGWAVVS